MSKVIIDPQRIVAIDELDVLVRDLNTQKIKLLFVILGISLSATDFERVLAWKLIIIAVPDRQMAMQLNKLCAYVPNLNFVTKPEEALFTLHQGSRGRRVWKSRG